MKIKYDNQTIDVDNQSSHPKKEFYTYWNDYFIQVVPDEFVRKHHKKKNAWVVCCVDPVGSYLVDAVDYGTVRQMVQLCFDNIDVPFKTIEDFEDDGE